MTLTSPPSILANEPWANRGCALQLESGAPTGVTARYEETISTGSVFWTSDPITVDPESDAATLFGPVLDLEGNISYGDAPGWHVDLILEGLDSGRSYTFAGTAMRGGGQGYAEHTHPLAIDRADAFTYASSQGLGKWVKTVWNSHGPQRGGLRGSMDRHPAGCRWQDHHSNHPHGRRSQWGAPEVLMPTRAMQGVFSWCSWSLRPPKVGRLSMTVPTRMVARKTPTSPPSILGEPALVLPRTYCFSLRAVPPPGSPLVTKKRFPPGVSSGPPIPSPSIPRVIR